MGKTRRAEMPCRLRVDNAESLGRSVGNLNAGPAIEAAWDSVADQREQELMAGMEVAVPLELVVARLAARFSA